MRFDAYYHSEWQQASKRTLTREARLAKLSRSRRLASQPARRSQQFGAVLLCPPLLVGELVEAQRQRRCRVHVGYLCRH
jgi:hypothetical protein